MSLSVGESYRYCRQVAKQEAKNFYYSFLLLPPAKRAAMSAVYAFMRRSDDIADDATSPDKALAGLRAWRTSLDRAIEGGAIDDPCLPALVDTIQRYGIRLEHFHDLLAGTEMDQSHQRYSTFAELYQYCYRVASCVGLVILPIFGYDDEQAEVLGEACGIAFQLTNILRDIREDAGLGRIYLPLEDLERFHVSESEVLDCQPTDNFRRLIEFEATRARDYYVKAAPLVELVHRDSRKTLQVMMAIYGGILDEIVAKNYAVLDRRIQLSRAEKWKIVLTTWLGVR